MDFYQKDCLPSSTSSDPTFSSNPGKKFKSSSNEAQIASNWIARMATEWIDLDILETK